MGANRAEGLRESNGGMREKARRCNKGTHRYETGVVSPLSFSHTSEKDVIGMCFTVNSLQSSPIKLILSASVKQTEERGLEIKR